MLRLHDTLSDSIRDFQPADGEVKLYVCGLTPYDATHLGHAFTMVSFDVLIRYLRYLGHGVRYVQNVTDVDDPLFEKARQLGVSSWDLAEEETERYLADMRDLNVLSPQAFPHASREIPEMIEIVERLFQTGHAYQVDGYVYFNIATDPEYGKLSKYDRETMIALARERGGDPDDPRRRDPLDFVLWRPSKAGEPRAPSPWGEGLPGWHVECSAMSLEYLGAPLDIHGGGSDLIFPHHENEIAQSEGATGVQPFARFWVHTGMVYLGGKKMSKSLGNMVFVRDLLPVYGPDALRLYLSGCHYRASLHHDQALLDRAAELARHLTEAAHYRGMGAAQVPGPGHGGTGLRMGERSPSLPAGDPPCGGKDPSTAALDATPYRDRFRERMNDDLDTPAAIGVLRELADRIMREQADGHAVESAQGLLCELGGVLGLRLDSPN